jgi:hypothetical protein
MVQLYGLYPEEARAEWRRIRGRRRECRDLVRALRRRDEVDSG